jgi:hypothetical protein
MQAQAVQVTQALQQAAQAFRQAAASLGISSKQTLEITAACTLLAAFGAAGITLWIQRRHRKYDAKLNLFVNLMAHRKARPPNQIWVNSLNVIDVIFYGDSKVIEIWHRLYPILLIRTTPSRKRIGTSTSIS